MKAKKIFTYKPSLSVAIFCIVSLSAALLLGQTAPAQSPAQTWKGGYPQDWTHRHLVFSNPGTYAQAAQNSAVDKWQKITTDTRYLIQQLARSGKAAPAASPGFVVGAPIPVPAKKASIQKDWGTSLDGTAASRTGTVSSNGAVGGTSTVTVGTQTFTASAPTTASTTGTFTGTPTAAQTATITNGSNALILTVGGTQKSGTISVSSRPGSTANSLVVGSVTYSFSTSCGSTSNCISRSSSGSPSTSQYAGNIYAAIANNAGLCTTYGTGSGCFANMTPNPAVVPGSFTASSSTSFTVANTTSSTLTFSSTDSNVTTSGMIAASTGSNACTTSTAGTFFLYTDTTIQAANLAAAITACDTSHSAVGVTATSTGATVTLTAAAAGSSGDNITLAEGLSNFTWAGPMTSGSDGTNSGSTFAYWSGTAAASPNQLAANIAQAIDDNTTLQASGGVTAASSSNVVTVTARTTGTNGNSIGLSASLTGFAWAGSTLANGASATGTVQPNTFPAKYSFDTTQATCTDFIVYPTGIAGSGTTANIIAYENLYTSGCSGAVPSVYWAYNTGGTVTTSPVLSLDGSQVAFIQLASGTADLVLLKWAASTTESTGVPMTLSSQTSAANYNSCVAPCMYTISFPATVTDTFSSPFYDYHDDALYVGDDKGNLRKFTGVFSGNPAAAASPWPVNLTTTNKLSSPVYDFISGHIIVGDWGGYLYYVTSDGSTHSAATGSLTGIALGNAIADAPIVDSTTEQVFAFVGISGTYSETGYSAVYQDNTTLNGTPGVTALAVTSSNYIGTGPFYLYAGDFDNVYYQSSAHTGHIYVVANLANTGGGALYQVGISGGSLTGASSQVVTTLNYSGTGATYPWPSPVSEFCNGACTVTTGGSCGAGVTCTNSGTDYVFFSVNRGTTAEGCSTGVGNGCVLSYNVSNPSSIPAGSSNGLNVTTPGTNGCWATGGIIIDNSVQTGTLAGASQIYFAGLNGASAGGSTVTSTNCPAAAAAMNAVQAAQGQ